MDHHSTSSEATNCKEMEDFENVGTKSQNIKASSEKSRGNWTNQFEFIFSCLGYTVGLANIWRFPYLCMRNGGGAFLIPYFLALIFCGIPLFFLEVYMGQFSGLSPIQVWGICPLMKGLGVSMFILIATLSTFYIVIICWTIYYLVKSFTKSLPWSSCDNSWNTPFCLERGTTDTLTAENNGSEFQQSSKLCPSIFCNWYNNTGQNNVTQMRAFEPISTNVTGHWRTPAEEFWKYNVLDITDGIEDLGGIKWDLLGTFVLGWIITFCCVIKGIKTSGKVVYVTATIPYFFITALLIRGATLPGAMDGIRYYIMPDWKKLLEFQVWAEAMLQIMYTLGPGWGGIITMASYNKFEHNCIRDALLIPLLTCLTSFYGGFVIFSVLGFMAKRANVSVKDVVASGPGLAFIVYPEAISHMPISPLWAICFFCMLLSVGLDSMFVMVETVTSSIVDTYPAYLRRHKTLFLAGACFTLLLLGIPFVTRGGIYLFQLMDWYIAMPVFFIFLFEFFTLSWIYGADRIYNDIELMTGTRPCVLWKISWLAISPAIVLALTIYSFIGLKSPTYGDYEYPVWLVRLFFGLSLCSTLAIPICSVHTLLHLRGSFIQRVRTSIKPSATWGPSDPVAREKYNSQHGPDIACCNNDGADVPLKIHTQL